MREPGDVTSSATSPCELGESALWDADRSRFYWVDIIGQDGLRAGLGQPAHDRRWPMPEPVGSRRRCAPAAGWWPRCATRSRTATSTAARSRWSVTLEADLAGNRFNDGAVDPRGPVLVRLDGPGRDRADRRRSTACDADTDGARAFGGIICSNGPAWSPDGRTMYHVDSTRQRITAYEFDPDDRCRRRRAGCSSPTRASRWYPDGVTVDADGLRLELQVGRRADRAVRPRRHASTGSSRCRCPGRPGARSSART